MLTKIRTATLEGVEGRVVTVETDLHRGLPSLTVVGLADATIKEACRRIRPAVMNSGYRFPDGRVTVNLSPAGEPKEGSHFDLPIAIGIITLGYDITSADDTAFLGELSLDGKINMIKGALPLVMSLRNNGVKNIILPSENAGEVSILPDVRIFPADKLKQASDHILGNRMLEIYKRRHIKRRKVWNVDFSQVAGQESAKRAALIGAAGNHGIMMTGGPGCGKTMIAKRIPTILPELTYEEKLEITGIYSVAGLLDENTQVIEERPFRSPHHTASPAAMVGGGRRPVPGEMSLAHRGVLFLDEFGEFDSRTIDAMRQPAEEGEIRLNRNMKEVVFPARTMLVLAANPCRCGNLWDEKKICTCSGRQLEGYMRKITGPFSDRIDLHVRMLPLSQSDICGIGKNSAEISSQAMRNQVEKAMEVQRKRYKGLDINSNGCLDEDGIKAFCRLDTAGMRMMADAYENMNLSMRAYHKVLKVARTIADLDCCENIDAVHVAEALVYRPAGFYDIKREKSAYIRKGGRER